MSLVRNTIRIGRVIDEVKKANITVINAVAFDIMFGVRQKVPIWLKIKKRFLVQSVLVEKANDGKPYARVGFAERAHPVIKLTETGGDRRPVRSRLIAAPLPTDGGRVAKPKVLLSRKNIFMRKISSVVGIWKSLRDGSLKLLYALKPETKYKKGTLRFADTAFAIAKTQFAKHYRNVIKKIR